MTRFQIGLAENLAIRRLSVLAALFLAAFVAVIPLRASQFDEPLSEGDVVAAASMRGVFGLRNDVGYVGDLMQSSDDAGRERWGIPLTESEAVQLDLDTRLEFDANAQDVIAFARSVPGFGGAFFDQLAGGNLTIQLVDPTDSTIETISQLAPSGNLTTSVEVVDHSLDELVGALSVAPDVFSDLAPSAQLVDVGVFEPENALIATVLPSDDPNVSALSDAAAAALGVPVIVKSEGGLPAPQACSRINCVSPVKAGIWIGNGDDGCTMGFQVVNASGDYQIVTAGHCGDHATDPQSWYHACPSSPGCGSQYAHLYLGTPKSNLYIPQNYSEDIQRIDLPNVQKSKKIYADSRLVAGWGWPVYGELVFVSLGHTNQIQPGYVTVTTDVYLLEGYYRLGTKISGLSTGGGDSGSPLYRWGTSGTAIALGVDSAGNGTYNWFGRIGEGLISWSGWDIYD